LIFDNLGSDYLYVSGFYYDSSFGAATNIYSAVYIGSTGTSFTEIGYPIPSAMDTKYSQGISYSGS
jgi:hypothetical protein